MIVKAVLVVNASGDVRASRRPKIGADEVGFALNITIPDGWGQVVGPPVSLTVPDAPSVAVEKRLGR